MSDIEFNNYDELVCKCGCDYLHQEEVTTVIAGASGKPGVSITFRCEQCGERPVLVISERKGCTSIKWS